MIGQRIVWRIVTSAMVVAIATSCSVGVPPASPTPTPQAPLSTLLAPPYFDQPALESCSAGIIGYIVEGPEFSGGIHFMCADGSFTRPIADRIPIKYQLEMDLSPDHDTIALAGLAGDDATTASLKALRFSDHSLTELAASQPRLRLQSPRWSPDGQYVGYVESLSITSLDWALKVLHIKTHTVSELLVKPDLYFWDWSPDGKRIVAEYVVDPGQAEYPETTIADINCDGAHRCALENEKILSVLGNAPMWAPNSELLAVVRGSGAAIDIIDSAGNRLQTIEAKELTPALSFKVPMVWSPDGQKMAFIAPAGLYVLNLGDKSITRLLPAQRDWSYHIQGWYP